MKIIKKYKKKRNSKLEAKLERDLCYFQREENEGLLRRRLFNMKDVSSIHVTTGGFAPSFVTVSMNDGFEIVSIGRGVFEEREALREAAQEVSERLIEVYGLNIKPKKLTKR